MSDYVLRHGNDAAYRLGILADAKRSSTLDLFKRLGLAEGMACLDVGCGTGEVAFDLARLVGERGRVVGVDIDGVALGLARSRAQNNNHAITFSKVDVRTSPLPNGFDLVYARFLLTHLADAVDALRRMRASAKRGGVVAIEDIDFSGHICYPSFPAFDRYLSLYQDVVRRSGGDALIGPKLPSMFEAAGFRQIQIEVVTPTFRHGPAKSVAAITMEHIRDTVVAAGLASHAEVDSLVKQLNHFANRSDTLVSISRVFQVWGHA